MRVAVVSSQIFPCPPTGYAGLEAIAYHTAHGLAKKGHKVTLIAPEGSHCEGATIAATGPPGQISEKDAFGRYWEILLQQDVVVDHSWNKWSYQAKIDGRLKAPVLGVLHAPVNTMYQTLPPIEKPCFVCISKDQASHFEALFSRQARVCYNGIDLQHYSSSNIPRTNRFLFLARFSSIKGPDIAIEACRATNVGLDLVGDTSITNEPEYLEKCKQMCDEQVGTIRNTKGSWIPVSTKQIRIVGPATRGECVYWFSQAHCMIHPNKNFREPFGLAPVEAMACGTPVIAWDNGAMRETIIPMGTGDLVTSNEDLVQTIELFRDMGPASIQEIRRQCREQAQKFSIQNMVDRYEELCHEAIQTGGW